MFMKKKKKTCGFAKRHYCVLLRRVGEEKVTVSVQGSQVPDKTIKVSRNNSR